MVINALAAKANFSPTATFGRFLLTSTTYFGLQPVRDLRRAAVSEFIEPPRYRCNFPPFDFVKGMDQADQTTELLGLDVRFEKVNAPGEDVLHD